MLVVVGWIATALGLIDSDKPIGEQTCSELADTFRNIQADLAPSRSFETQIEATKDAGELVDRIAELGGCASEPTLQ